MLLCLLASLTMTACVTLPAASHTAPAIAVDPNDVFAGKWEGVVVSYSPQHEKRSFRMSIAPTGIHVYAQNSETGMWWEFLDDKFRISQQGSNLIIQATDTGKTKGITRVETHVFVMTSKTKDELQVEHVRLVNNIDTPPSDPEKIFARHHSGSFTRWKGVKE
jgi:hypothetical protein